MKNVISYFFGIIVLTVSGQNAIATVIDFESLYINDSSPHSIASGYTEDGFIITGPGDFGFRFFGAMEPNFVGSTSLFNNTLGDTTTFKKIDNSIFSIYSIDLNELRVDGAVSVEFSAITDTNATINQKFDLDGSKATVQTFTFNALFSSIKQLTWDQGTAQLHQFDNLVTEINAVPLPAALPLYAGGLIAFGLTAYRRKRKNALEQNRNEDILRLS